MWREVAVNDEKIEVRNDFEVDVACIIA